MSWFKDFITDPFRTKVHSDYSAQMHSYMQGFGGPITNSVQLLPPTPADTKARERRLELEQKGRAAENAEALKEATGKALEELRKLKFYYSYTFCPKCNHDEPKRTYVNDHQVGSYGEKFWKTGYVTIADHEAVRRHLLHAEVIKVDCGRCGYEMGFERTADNSEEIRPYRPSYSLPEFGHGRPYVWGGI